MRIPMPTSQNDPENPRSNTGRAFNYKYLTAQKRHQTNPPFDPRLTTLKGPQAPAGGLKRGYLVTRSEIYDWTLHFLYNPSEVNLSAGANMDIPADNTFDPEDTGTLVLGTDAGIQASWSLLFDRTYETWDRSKADTVIGRYGVRADVRALLGMVGMVTPGEGAANTVGYDTISSVMVNTPVQVYFGGKSALSFYGYLNSLTISYTHFTAHMVPNRCVVGLEMRVIPKPVDPKLVGSRTKKGKQRR